MAAYYSDDFLGSQPMDMDTDDDSSGGYGTQQSGSSTQNSADSPETLREFFTSTPRFRFIRALPPGSSAHPLLFAEHEVVEDGAPARGPENEDQDKDRRYKSGRLKRRIVVKSALETTNDADLRNEKRWMDALAGSPHIIASIDLGLDTSPLKRQLVVMEYAAHGDLCEFVERLQEGEGGGEDGVKVVVPNRVLWRFFLCREYWPPPLDSSGR